MKVVILQPSYVPWRGYFHQIQKADIFVFYDCVQYDDRGWRNRNQVKTPQGLQWLTIPVKAKGSQVLGTPIKEIPIVWDCDWAKRHLETLRHAYGKTRFFGENLEFLQSFYSRRDTFLADFTCELTTALARRLGIAHTRFERSSNLPAKDVKSGRLLSILRHLGATHYISGPSARTYIEEAAFAEAGITIEYMHYNYPPYPQPHGAFEPHLSILDLLFNTGPDASKYIWMAGTTP